MSGAFVRFVCVSDRFEVYLISFCGYSMFRFECPIVVVVITVAAVNFMRVRSSYIDLLVVVVSIGASCIALLYFLFELFCFFVAIVFHLVGFRSCG